MKKLPEHPDLNPDTAPRRQRGGRGQAEPAMRIDIHSHLLPSIDDGCRSLEESIDCVHRLKAAGYVGTICTPHIWPAAFPGNLPAQIRDLTVQLRGQLAEAGIDYQIWPGGELRLFEGVIPFLEQHGVPTLADSRYVLVDFWDKQWPAFANKAFEWLLSRQYQPILAHPERIPDGRGDLDRKLREVEEMGVLLQGNTRSLTGGEGMAAADTVRRLLAEQRYTFIALDMHRPDSLNSRLDGLALLEIEFGRAAMDHLTIEAPRRIAKFG